MKVASNNAKALEGMEQPSVVPISVATVPIGPAQNKHWLGKRPRVTIALLAMVPVLALIGIAIYKWGHTARPAFRTVQVVRADITERVTATGTLQPVITSPVGAQVSGIVWKLHADYNSKVKAGDLLVELDPALFQNAVASATAQLAQAEANLTSAQAAALGARIIRDRTQIVESKSLVSKADLDATVAIFGQTTGAARSSVALIALARAQLDRAKLDLEHSSKIRPARASSCWEANGTEAPCVRRRGLTLNARPSLEWITRPSAPPRVTIRSKIAATVAGSSAVSERAQCSREPPCKSFSRRATRAGYGARCASFSPSRMRSKAAKRSRSVWARAAPPIAA